VAVPAQLVSPMMFKSTEKSQNEDNNGTYERLSVTIGVKQVMMATLEPSK